jgi:prepilin-type processing-associated H-X9-DG protein
VMVVGSAYVDTIPSTRGPTFNRYASWLTWILPNVEQDARFKIMRQTNNPNGPPGGILPLYVCPSEPRGALLGPLPSDYTSQGNHAPTFYVGVAGTAVNTTWPINDGMLFNRSRVKLTDVTDGTSTTLMVGERPPSPIFDWGWWDTAVAPGLLPPPNRGPETRDMDVVMGVAERGPAGPSGPQYSDDESDWDSSCPTVSGFSFAVRNPIVPVGSNKPNPPQGLNVGPPCWDNDCGPYAGGGTPSNFCDFYHFWSNHTGGAYFCFGDGSVRFIQYTLSAQVLNYQGKPIHMMDALATRAGGEPDPRAE